MPVARCDEDPLKRRSVLFSSSDWGVGRGNNLFSNGPSSRDVNEVQTRKYEDPSKFSERERVNSYLTHTCQHGYLFGMRVPVYECEYKYSRFSHKRKNLFT